MWIKTKAAVASLKARSLAIVLLLAWCFACWWGTGIWQDKAATQVYDDARQRTEQFIATSVAGYERIIATRRGMIRVLAREQTYRDALSRYSPLSADGDEDERRRRWNADPQLTAISRQLATAARDLGMRTIWLMDANGDCIASSNAGEPKDHVGARYADRDYFQEAIAGRSAHQVNIGRRQLGASISFSAPVTDRNGRVIGALASGNDLSTFSNWLDQANAFFTDRHGVVMLAKDPAMLLRALPNAPAQSFDAVTREKLYKTSDILTLNLPSQGEDRFPELLRSTDGTAPAILGSRSVTGGEPVLHVLRPLPELSELSRRRAVTAGMLGLVGVLLFLLVAGTLRRRREQRATALALAQREQQATQARNFLDQIVNAIPDPVFVKDREHRWVLINQACCDLAGQPRENLLGKSDFDFFPEKEARVFWDKDELVFNAGIENVNEEKFTDSQGVTRIIVTKKSPITTAQGKQFLVGIIFDISARKQTERLMRAKEREFRTLAENNPDVIIRYDRECRRIYANSALATMAGHKAEELLGRLPLDHTPLVDPESYMAELRRVMVSGTPSSFEVPVLRANGEAGWYASRIVPEFDEGGQVVGVLAVARDITGRKHMEEALAAREQEFRSLAENLPVAVIRYDSECRRRYLNPSAERMLHSSTSELLGLVPGRGGVPASPTMIAHYRGKMDEVLATGAARELNFVLDMLPADQQEHYEVRFVPEHGADGKTGGVLAIWHDITDRKKTQTLLELSEREYRSLAANLPDDVIRWDVDGCYLYINPAHERTLGVSANDMIGKAITDSHTFVKAAIAQVVATGQAAMLVRQSVVVDGEIQIHEVSLAAEHDAEGHLVSVLGIGRDMTDIYRLQDAIAAREAEFRTLVDQAPEPIFRYTPDGRRMYVNAAVERISGIPASVLLGGPSTDGKIVPAHDGAAVVALVRRICETGEPGEVEVENVGADGRRRHFHNRLAPEFGADGKVRSVFSICHDITERQRAEIALQENFDRITELNLYLTRQAQELAASQEQLHLTEAWYRSILRSAPDGMLVIDRLGVIVQANAQLEALFGYEEKELIGNHVEILLPAAIREMHVKKRVDFVAIGRVDRPMVSPLNLRACRKDGSEFFVDISLSQLPDIAGRVGAICAVIRDISERKRMENELQRGRLALEDAQRIGQIGSWEFDLVSGVLNCSDEAFRMFEIASTLFSASIDAFMNAVHPEDRERVSTAYDASVKTRTAYDVEHRLLFPDGRIKYVRERGETRYNADGRPLRTLGTVQNITEAKLAEARLRKSHDILRALAAHQETEHEKVRRQLAYDIHEDLAQNLAALRLNISLFERSGESIQAAALLNTMSAIADSSIVRIRDIVSMLRPTVLDLGLVPALHWLTDDFKGFGFQFDLVLPEDILLNDDVSTFLFRAAQEALINSALHAAATHIHLSLDTVAGVCCMVVRDNGCGFDPAAPRREGCFGLIRLTEQARNLGGYLSIDSRSDQGAALEFHVPAFLGHRS
ncbi:MAG: PAS domain S-box protein [Rhodoferax sp.]|nr:PAS domain S-box protein [Rhodoferax sp.]